MTLALLVYAAGFLITWPAFAAHPHHRPYADRADVVFVLALGFGVAVTWPMWAAVWLIERPWVWRRRRQADRHHGLERSLRAHPAGQRRQEAKR